ncbi:bromodomain and WD repeat-containing protein 3 isoform X2 [Nilaparvata lugens]|uniref:bromodomain and WD repeat-containing protein 3 isoform X2 n=1 Tax=Nilaparvata lugens TaxID=108931 RepID=UPI00193E044F|nr:bromodomain and WD repeat-containing protein 3 isoform X2 [Nilaparvata lugens]
MSKKEVNATNFELYFLITKFLENGPCSKSAQVLKEELLKNEIIPKRYDWEGEAHKQSYNELERQYPHIGAEHLPEICRRIIPLLDKEFPSAVAGLTSLLGTGKQSIMRNDKGSLPTWRTLVECSIRRHQSPLPRSITCRNHHIVNVLHGRELSGPFSRSQAFPPTLYSRMQLLCRNLGHLSCVYCVLFDGSGNYVITGADDMLVKVWSAVDGRLLATLRGVLSEVTDIAINVDNTLLAAGNVDRVIRVWCLQTGYPVATLVAHSGMITGVNFCPTDVNGIHYLASTSTDGSVAFWSYTVSPNQTVNFQTRALQYNERLRPGQAQMICASFSPGGMFLAAGSADHHVRVYKMAGEAGPHRILETEPHADRVDSIQWAHSGLRFISGSKDGTAIIWRFAHQRWKTQVLSMATTLSGKCSEPDMKQKLKVTMVCWNANDSCVVTASNDFAIRVWDSETAKLCQLLKGHNQEVFVLESHPYDSDVLLSAGHDGLILVWDLHSGAQLASFLNSVDTQNTGAVFDAKWSPDGTMVAATDSHGHILLFGLGFVSDRIKKLPKELFFHTDYRPLSRDEASHSVVDEQTQVAPHLMPPPFLVDVDGNPYPPYLQRLVPGRENCHTEQLVPNIIMSSDGLQEVIEGVDGEEPRSHIDHMIQQLVQRSDQSSQPATRPVTSPRSARIRGRGDVEGVRQSSGNWQKDEFTWTRRRLIPFLEKGRLEISKQKVKAAADFEIEEYNREMQRPIELKPAPMTSAEFVKRPRKRNTHSYRTRASRVEHMLQNENEDGEALSPSASEDSSSHKDSTARSEDMDSSSSDSSSSDYSDWIADHGAALEPPKRNKRTCNKAKLPKAPAVAAAASSAPEPSTSTANAKKPNVVEVPELYRPSEWLSEVIPKKFPYYPQMGDEVLFFREGYQMYLDAVKNRGVYDLQPSQITPWGKINIKEPELVKIIGIKYELRPPRLCCLRLAAMKQNGRLTGDRFTIKYHDVPDVIDFLVLRQTYETAVARNWDVGDRFRSMIDDKWWWGKILSRRSDAQSEFLSYFTQWDNCEQENMSPWDMEPVDPTREPVVEGGSVAVVAEEIAAILYHPRPDEWPGGNRDMACERILRGLDDIMGLSVAEPFIAPVDINQYPTYAFIVEYPIDLSTIKGRFENRFYRRVTAAQFDVRYLATNAEKFNEDHSPILRHARIVTDLCLRVIKEVSDIDVPVLYRQLLEAYRSESSDEAFDPVPSTSRRSARMLRRSKPATAAVTSPDTQTMFDWRRACKEMLDCLWANKDSEPFREPVDRLEHPDYDKIVSTPMDLWTVREELRGNNYENHKEFYKDVQLIFINSKKYSPDPRSRIYGMTSRMANLAEKLMDDLLQKWRSSRRQNRGRKMRKTKPPRKKAVAQTDNGVASDSDEELQSPKTSSSKPSKNDRMQTRVVKKEVKYTMSSSASDQDEDTNNEETPHKMNHKVNGYAKQRPKRSGSTKKQLKFADEGVAEEESDDAGEGTSGMFNDHNYMRKSAGEREHKSQLRKKRPKPNSDSDNGLAESSSHRPQRSVKRKNYAAMVASASDSADDGKPKPRSSTHSTDLKSRGKSIKKRSLPSPKKDVNRTASLPRSSAVVYPQSTSQSKSRRIKTRPAKKRVNYVEENGTISSDDELDDEHKLSQKIRQGRMQMRPLKKDINYEENREASSSENDGVADDFDYDENEDDQEQEVKQENGVEEESSGDKEEENGGDEEEEEIIAVEVVKTKVTEEGDTKHHKNAKDAVPNGVENPRTTRTKTKVVYNEDYDDEDNDDDDDDGDNDSDDDKRKVTKPNQRVSRAEPSCKSKRASRDEEESEDDDESSEDDEDDDDYYTPNRAQHAKKVREIARRSKSSTRNSDSNAPSRKRRKVGSESDSDSNLQWHGGGTSSRPHAGRRVSEVASPSKGRLRRSKRPHRPVVDDGDVTTGESHESDGESPQISISSRGRLRKISPRVRAFLGD